MNHTMILLLAEMTQQQALDSIRQNMGHSVDIQLLAWVIVLTLVIVAVLVILNRRAVARRNAPALNSQSKLIKEVAQALELKPAELKKLRILAEQINEPGQSVSTNPLLLLICPSQLAEAMKKK